VRRVLSCKFSVSERKKRRQRGGAERKVISVQASAIGRQEETNAEVTEIAEFAEKRGEEKSDTSS